MTSKSTLTVLALQITSTTCAKENLATIEQFLQRADMTTVDIVVIPEMFAQFGVANQIPLAESERDFNGTVGQTIRQWARQWGVYFVAGTLPTLTEHDARPRARCHVVNPQGHIETIYDKIHLFDASVSDAQGRYQESASYSPGDQVVTFDLPWGRIGLAVCYDLRFPELFRALADAGAQAVILPSAFTKTTGAAHWQVLNRARAIENGLYMVAVNQTGQHSSTRETYGHSMLVNPWGDVFDVGDGVGGYLFTLDAETVDTVRQKLPVHQHRRL